MAKPSLNLPGAAECINGPPASSFADFALALSFVVDVFSNQTHRTEHSGQEQFDTHDLQHFNDYGIEYYGRL